MVTPDNVTPPPICPQTHLLDICTLLNSYLMMNTIQHSSCYVAMYYSLACCEPVVLQVKDRMILQWIKCHISAEQKFNVSVLHVQWYFEMNEINNPNRSIWDDNEAEENWNLKNTWGCRYKCQVCMKLVCVRHMTETGWHVTGCYRWSKVVAFTGSLLKISPQTRANHEPGLALNLMEASLIRTTSGTCVHIVYNTVYINCIII